MSTRIDVTKRNGKYVVLGPNKLKSTYASHAAARRHALERAQHEYNLGYRDILIDDGGRTYSYEEYARTVTNTGGDEKYAKDLYVWMETEIQKQLTPTLGSRIAHRIASSAAEAGSLQYLKIARSR